MPHTTFPLRLYRNGIITVPLFFFFLSLIRFAVLSSSPVKSIPRRRCDGATTLGFPDWNEKKKIERDLNPRERGLIKVSPTACLGKEQLLIEIYNAKANSVE